MFFSSTTVMLAKPAASQTDSDVTQQIWLDFDPSRWLTPRVELFGDVGVRWGIDDRSWWRLVVRPSVGVPVSRFRVTGGVGNFFNFNDIIEDRWEVRPFQGVSTVWPHMRVDFDHYLRLEERFDFNTETWNSLNSLRLRYRLRVRYQWSAAQLERHWAATASGEVFVTLAGEEGQQQEEIRVTAGIERSFSRSRRLRMEITWQQESLYFRPGERINEFYLRIRLYRRW